MPRKSTSSVSVGDSYASLPSAINGAAASTHDGETSVLSAATDVSAAAKPRANAKAPKEDTDSVGVDDLLLPRTLTSRLARGVLPPNTSIQKDALLALTKAATVFISYLAHNANELTPKKTVGPQDVLKAIQEVEMGGLMGLGAAGADGTARGRLERELEVFESVVKGKRKGYREKVKARESGASNIGGERESEDRQESVQREAKRARLEDGDERDQHGGLHQARTRDGVAPTAHILPPPLQHNATSMPPHPPVASTNGSAPHLPNTETISDDELEDHQDDSNSADREADDAPSEEDDEDQDEEEEEEDEDEDEDEDEGQADEDELNGYGPDDQLRRDMNGGEEAEEDEDADADDNNETEHESD